MSAKRGGRRFGAHTLRLTKLFSVTYSALTFKKKILTRRIHTPYSHAIFTRRTHTPTRSSGGFGKNLSESSGFGKKLNAVLTHRTHTPYTHAVQQSQLPVHWAELLPIQPVHRAEALSISKEWRAFSRSREDNKKIEKIEETER